MFLSTQLHGIFESVSLPEKLTHLPPTDILGRVKLLKGKPLGKGSFGVVKRAYVLSTKAVRAVKFIAIERMKEKFCVLKNEIEIMKAVDHPNIIMLYEIFEDHRYLCLVMELCSGGTLLGRLKLTGHFCEDHTAICMKQILRAVFYLHRNWIVHRDLKAENVLLSTTENLNKTLLKISDFGLSTTFRPKQVLTERVGTLTHMSPEVLDRKCPLCFSLPGDAKQQSGW
eukprot:symbB.v1.2.016514.t1/scaffold1256.1/size241426/2